jgi:hypothetical protein
MLPKGAAFVGTCLALRVLNSVGGSACETSVITLAISQYRGQVSTALVSDENCLQTLAF